MTGSGSSKRFWSAVTVTGEEPELEVRLDARPVMVPGHGTLRLPNRALAEAIAAEWRDAGGGAPGGSYAPDAVGLTRLAGTMSLRVAPDRAAVIGQLLPFLDSDLLCYRATHPAPLVRQQEQQWQPWLEWCRARFGAALASTDGIMPFRQDPAAHAAIARALGAQDDAGLTALGVLAPALNSLVLGLACADGALSAADAHALSLLDDHFQAGQWGEDHQNRQRQLALLSDCVEAERFLLLARPDRPHTLLLVDGRVQGVGFRVWLQREAIRLGLGGWVRNLGDGRVEALLCGPAAARDALVRLAHDGPSAAAVRTVRTRSVGAGTASAAQGGFAVAATASSPER